jgi:hypothetical protein
MRRQRVPELLAAAMAIPLFLSGCHHKVISGGELNRRAILETGRRVSEIRGLPFLREVRFRLVGTTDVARTARADARARRHSGKASRQSRWLSLLGLIPEGVDPAAAVETIVTSRPAGLFRPEQNRLEIVNQAAVRSEIIETLGLFLDRDLTFGEILAHELVHTLQHQHFGLGPPAAAIDNQDARLAHVALAEGDATLVGFELGVGGIVTDPASFFGFARRHAPDLGKGVPSYMKERFKFPYLDGASFVLALAEQGGTRAIDGAHRNPPLSTEHILHPEKYIQEIDPPRLPVLDDLSPPSPGYAAIFQDTLGEFGIRVLLGQAFPAHQAAQRASGWAGDRSVVFEQSGTQSLVLVWVIDWDTPADAASFFDGLDAVVSLRAGAPQRITPREVDWHSHGRIRHLEIWQNRVVYVDGPAHTDLYAQVQESFRAGVDILEANRSPEEKSPGEAPTAKLEELFRIDPVPPRPVATPGPADDRLALGALLQVGGRRGDENGLKVLRMRVRATGLVTDMLDLKLHLEVELNGEDPLLTDAALSFSPVSPNLLYLGHLWIGRFRVPYSRSVLTDPEFLPLNRRPLVDLHLAPFRRAGLMYDFNAGHYGVPLRLRAGAFDGYPEGEGLGPLTVVRLDFSPDVWLPGSWELTLGAAYSFDESRRNPESNSIADAQGVNLDLAVGFQGYRLGGAYFFADRLEGGGWETTGWSVSASAFLLEDFLQVAGRYEELNRPDLPTLRGAGAGANLFYLEERFVMSYHFFWQAETGTRAQKIHMLLFQVVL